MTDSTEGREDDGDWASLSRAAEDFARRVARDAGKFAERMEEHAGEFARDVSRDWRRAQRRYQHVCRRAASAPEVRRVFEDIRTVVADVLEGVDELIERVFTEPAPASNAEWVHLVVNRDAPCSSCAQTISAGEEAFVQRTAAGPEFRCSRCGVPSAT